MKIPTLIGVCLLGIAMISSVARAAESESPVAAPPNTSSLYQPPLANTAMNKIVEKELLPQLDYFFEKLVTEKEKMEVDGVAVFAANDKFLPGKIANALSYLLLNTPRDDPKFQRYLVGYRDIAERTINDANDSWGMYYYASALYKLKKAGLLEQAVSPQTLALLKIKLDWRSFVNTDNLTLKGLPTNYFGVAFSIARLRMLLGWEDETASQKLLEKMLAHYETYSGQYGFSDETEGEGRFDRYSILLIAEICQRFIETDMQATPQLKKWLRNSANLALGLGNLSGDGFVYGRSVGAYGDTAILEILSAAATLGVLTRDEKNYAYAYSNRIVAKYVDFWYDKEMRSVNLWEKGRRTDNYRSKNRILGENFTLLHQIIYTNNLWSAIGFKNKRPKADLQTWLDKTQPTFKLTWFAQGPYDRALATFRDKAHVFNLPMVNGGSKHHASTPYFPIPFANTLVAGSPESIYPQLLPQFSLADGTELMPTSTIRKITTSQRGDQYLVNYAQDELNRIGASVPIKDGRITLKTEYKMESGSITRTDIYTPVIPVAVKKITMEFASFSEQATLDGTTVRFNKGDVTQFAVSGLTSCKIDAVETNNVYKSPVGASKTRIQCQSGEFTMDKPVTIKWVMTY